MRTPSSLLTWHRIIRIRIVRTETDILLGPVLGKENTAPTRYVNRHRIVWYPLDMTVHETEVTTPKVAQGVRRLVEIPRHVHVIISGPGLEQFHDVTRLRDLADSAGISVPTLGTPVPAT